MTKLIFSCLALGLMATPASALTQEEATKEAIRQLQKQVEQVKQSDRYANGGGWSQSSSGNAAGKR